MCFSKTRPVMKVIGYPREASSTATAAIFSTCDQWVVDVIIMGVSERSSVVSGKKWTRGVPTIYGWITSWKERNVSGEKICSARSAMTGMKPSDKRRWMKDMLSRVSDGNGNGEDKDNVEKC